MIGILRLAGLQYLGALVDVDPVQEPERFAPATLTGLLFGFLGLVAKGVSDVLSALSSGAL